MTQPNSYRLMSFNIHKGLSPFWRNYTLPIIKDIIQENHVDFVCLQEIGSRYIPKSKDLKFETQLEFLAHLSWPHMCYGKNAIYSSGHHGNAILSHFPIVEYKNTNISVNSIEHRGLLSAKIQISDHQTIEVSSTHLNLLEKNRTQQIDKIIHSLSDHRYHIMAGDFNDWRSKLNFKIRKELHMEEAFSFLNKKSTRSFPSFFPLLPLDRIYFSKQIQPLKAFTVKTSKALIASDHIPLVFDFNFKHPL